MRRLLRLGLIAGAGLLALAVAASALNAGELRRVVYALRS
jgi:DUF1009 family protein